MPKTVKCPCGTALSIRPELEGKSVRCPKCQQALKIPFGQTQSGAPKRGLTCKCGARINVKPELAGQKIRCPKCKTISTAPGVARPTPVPKASPIPPPSDPWAQMPASNPYVPPASPIAHTQVASQSVVAESSGILLRNIFNSSFGRIVLTDHSVRFYRHSVLFSALGLLGALLAKASKGTHSLTLDFANIREIQRVNSQALKFDMNDGSSYKLSIYDFKTFSGKLFSQLRKQFVVEASGDRQWKVGPPQRGG